MLILSRKSTEVIMIGDNIAVRVVAIHGNRVKLGIEAPPQTKVLRGELVMHATPAQPAVAAYEVTPA